MLGTQRFSAVSGATSGDTKKATSSDGVTLQRRKAVTKQGGFLARCWPVWRHLSRLVRWVPEVNTAGQAKDQYYPARWIVKKGGKALKHLAKVQIEVILDTGWVGKHREAYTKYSLPHKPKASDTLVIILENYFYGDGTHWMTIYNDEFRDVEFFDSFVMRLRMTSTGLCKGREKVSCTIRLCCKT